MNDLENDTPKYKKKSQGHPPTKTKHKHEFQDCVFEWDNPNGEFSKEKGFIVKREIFGGSYCVICGKINHRISFDWFEIERNNSTGFIRHVLSEKAQKEINPDTRTLPVFYLKDKWHQKYV